MPGQFSNALQLMAKNGHDRALVGAAPAAPWRAAHRREVNYSVDNVLVEIAGSNELGRNSTTTIPREADLLTGMTVCISLPGLAGDAFYVDRAGFKLVRKVEIMLGNQCVQSFDGEYIEMWQAFTQTAGKGLKEMVGNFDSDAERLANAKQAHRLYVPIPAFFAEEGKALPIGALVYQDLTVRLQMNGVETVLSDSNAALRQPVRAIGNDRKTAAGGSGGVRNTDCAVHFECQYVYLEKGMLAPLGEDLAITQVQAYVQDFDASSRPQQSIELDFNHPCRELLWRVDVDLAGVGGDLLPDPVASAMLSVNSHKRWSQNNGDPVEGRYFRTVQPYQYHSSVPRDSDDGFYYCYCFDETPESATVGASLNFSRIDHTVLDLALDSTYARGTLMVYARTWNVLRIADGTGALLFAS